MGDKKQKEAAQKKLKKVLFVIAAVLFVVVMVVSSMGMSWISGIAPIKAGDQVVLDYTMYDAAGNPFLTTSQQLYQQLAEKGQGVMYAKPMTLTANQSLRQAVFPLQVYVGSDGSWREFALYNGEYGAISNAVVGMRTNEKKKVVFPSSSSMNMLFTPEDMAKSNVDINSLEIGDTLSMGVSENPDASASNITADTYIRLGNILRKSSEGVVVDFGYPYTEITVSSFAQQ